MPCATAGELLRDVYILLNGSFGVGKSSVARALRGMLSSAVIADPEWIGVALQRVFRRHRDDFQSDPVWRRLAIAWIRLRGAFGSTVIVPLACSNVTYLEELRAGLARGGNHVRHFCLTAPVGTIRERLERRGEPLHDPRWGWVHRRAEECCAVHALPAFAEQIPTEDRLPGQVAELLLQAVDVPS